MSLAHPDGTMRKAVKNRLLNELETFVTLINQLPKIAENEIWIIDGMASIQMMSVQGLKTFGDLSDTILKMVMKPFQNSNCQRVDVTFDIYDVIDSIKSFERRRHQKSVSFEMKISGPQNALPKQWKKFLENPKNKANLVAFICEQWSLKASSMLVAGQCYYYYYNWRIQRCACYKESNKGGKLQR